MSRPAWIEFSSELAGRTVAYLFMEARLVAGEVRLTEEHEAFRWISLAELLTIELCPQFRAFAEDYCRTRGYSRRVGIWSALQALAPDIAADWQPTPIFERIISPELACSHLKSLPRPSSLAHAAVVGAASQLYLSLPENVFLRASDRLHLVTALHQGFEEICTFDRRQQEAAQALGLTIATI